MSDISSVVSQWVYNLRAVSIAVTMMMMSSVMISAPPATVQPMMTSRDAQAPANQSINQSIMPYCQLIASTANYY